VWPRFLLVGVLLVGLACTEGNDSGSNAPATIPRGESSGGGSQASATPDPTQGLVLIQKFKDAGIPIGEAINLSAENDPNQLLGRPGQYVNKWRFEDERISRLPPGDMTYAQLVEELDVDDGGTVEVFNNAEEAKRRAEYVQSITMSIPFLNEYSWQVEEIFLRVGKGLTPAQAADYERVLREALR
jgi:hypothetical protein